MYKKRAPQLRLVSIFPLKSAPQLRFLYTLRLMSHKAIYFASRCASRLITLKASFFKPRISYLPKTSNIK
ncbi:hypothetical protein Hanom_Chr00s007105g01736521 [Helianthus anomalus]